jgi:hypothetical protein
MRLTEQEIKQIIKEEFANLVNEEEIDEKLLSALKGIGKGLFDKATDFMSGKPKPNASQGVGRSFARYKVPQKQPMGQPEKKPDALVPLSPQEIEGPFYPDSNQNKTKQGPPFGSTITVNRNTALGTGEKPAAPAKDVVIKGQLPQAQKTVLQLPAPERIGIVASYGDLMSSAKGEGYNKLHERCVSYFKELPYFAKLNDQEKIKSFQSIDTILKHLISTKRILQNTTIAPVPMQEDNRPTPSMQQMGEEEFNSWYPKSLLSTTKKYFANSKIPEVIITFVIDHLFKDGRLAISQRFYNKLIHSNDARVVTSDLPQEPTESEPESTESQPEPIASQPEPIASQPEPIASTNSPTEPVIRKPQKGENYRQYEKYIDSLSDEVVETYVEELAANLDSLRPSIVTPNHADVAAAKKEKLIKSLLDNPNLREVNKSKSYDNFYNNWKRYTKPGVKI